MKKEFIREIEIPNDVEVNLIGNDLTIKGPQGTNKRELKIGKATIEIKDNKIILMDKRATKKEKKLINTAKSHIENMIKGVKEKFEYKLKICSSHFPITVNIKDGKAIIKNFLGEKIDREAKIPEGVEVKVDKEFITVSSTDKELVGQAAANLENSTKIRNRDRRIFQDGIYITNKPGKVI